MVPCVPIMIMVYRKKAITIFQEKKWKRKKYKKGGRHTTIAKLANEIQLVLLLKMFMREKASDQSCFDVGTINSPFSFCQPYEGG